MSAVVVKEQLHMFSNAVKEVFQSSSKFSTFVATVSSNDERNISRRINWVACLWKDQNALQTRSSIEAYTRSGAL